MPPSLAQQPLMLEAVGAAAPKEAAMRALVRALARQAAAEMFAGARAALNEEPTCAPKSQADQHL